MYCGILPGQSAPGRDRTCDHRIRSPLLYPLSYGRPTAAPGDGGPVLRVPVAHAALCSSPRMLTVRQRSRTLRRTVRVASGGAGGPRLWLWHYRLGKAGLGPRHERRPGGPEEVRVEPHADAVVNGDPAPSAVPTPAAGPNTTEPAEVPTSRP